MANPVIDNAGQLVLNWSGPQRTWKNVIGLTTISTFPTFNQALAESIFTAIRNASSTTALMTHMATTTILESVSIRSLAAANQPLYTSTGVPLAGGGAGDSLPLSVAACVTIRTPLAGKSFRGRVYLSGWDEGENDASGRITGAANAAAQAFMSGLDQAIQAENLVVGIISKARDAVTIPAKTIPSKNGFVTARNLFLVRDTKWESQRRRTGRS